MNENPALPPLGPNPVAAIADPKARRDEFLIVVAIILFTLVFRLLTLQIINTGPDEFDYWFSAKKLATGAPYPELDHRSVRWGIIVPTALVQLVLGFDAWVYIVPPLAASLAQSVLLYLLGRRFLGRRAAVCAVVILTMFPYMIRSAGQIRPEIFSVTYVVASILLLLSHIESPRWRFQPLLGAAICLFLAYQTKITNLYFLPAFVWVLWKPGAQRTVPGAAHPPGVRRFGLARVFLFGGTLLALYLGEHAAYAFLAGEPLGHLGIIMKSHLSSDYAKDIPATFWGLFGRYAPEKFPPLWMLLFGAYAGSVVYLARGEAGRATWFRLLGLSTAGFLVFITFAVKGLDPIRPVEAFQNRYFTALMPTLALTIAAAGERLARLAPPWAAGSRSAPTLDAAPSGPVSVASALGVLLVLTLAVFASGLLPKSFAEYYTRPQDWDKHPLKLYFDYQHMAEAAYRDGVPIVVIDSNDGVEQKAVETVNLVFLQHEDRGLDSPPPLARVPHGHGRLHYLVSPAFAATFDPATLQDPATPVLIARRKPFSLTPGTIAGLGPPPRGSD